MEWKEVKRLAIAECLGELLREKPGKDVTVTELCKRADISRAGFYLYFADIYAVGEWLWTRTIRSLFMQLGDGMGLTACICALLNKMRDPVSGKVLDFARHGSCKNGTWITQQIFEIYSERVPALRGTPLTEEELERLRYALCAHEIVIDMWYREGMQTEPSLLASIVVDMIPSFIVDVLGK